MYPIQQASTLAQIPSSTIRYYEKIQLIPPVARTTSGNRTFNDKDIEVLNLIRCFRHLGMSIEEIRENLTPIHGFYEQVDTKEILFQHKKKLEEQIHLLTSFIQEIDLKITQ